MSSNYIEKRTAITTIGAWSAKTKIKTLVRTYLLWLGVQDKSKCKNSSPPDIITHI
jgi:hypothetical protein